MPGKQWSLPCHCTSRTLERPEALLPPATKLAQLVQQLHKHGLLAACNAGVEVCQHLFARNLASLSNGRGGCEEGERRKGEEGDGVKGKMGSSINSKPAHLLIAQMS